jgi:uncharacterized protein (TIGR04141 family)
MPPETQQVGVYEIDKSHFEGLGVEEMINQIIERANRDHAETRKFKEQVLKSGLNLRGFQARVFYSRRPSTPRWVGFWEKAIKEDEDMLKREAWIPSYIAFLWTDNHLFATTGGLGNFAIQDFINPTFGIEIASRLLSRDSNVIKALQERDIAGSLIGSTKFYRKSSKFRDEDEFGKFYREVKVSLDMDLLAEKFGFPREELARGSMCVANSSFQINKSIDFETLLEKVLKGLEEIFRERPRFKINKVIPIPNRGNNKAKVEALSRKLMEQLYQRYLQGDSYPIDFDLCHPDFERYLTAQVAKVFNGVIEKLDFDGALINVDILFEAMKNSDEFRIEDEDDFQRAINGLTIRTFDDDGREMTRAKMLKHIHGDVRDGSKTYFFVDGCWYQVDRDFVKELDESCALTVANKYREHLLTQEWSSGGEDEYNGSYIGNSNTVVLHRVLPDGVELCDVLQWDDENVYLMHVKRGFNNMMRDLTYQAFIAARRLLEDRASQMEFASAVYDAMVACQGSSNSYLSSVGNQANGLTKDEFIGHLRGKKPVVVLGILDTSQRRRDIRGDMKEFNSYIAKFTVLELHKKLKMLEFDLGIAQIQRV